MDRHVKYGIKWIDMPKNESKCARDANLIINFAPPYHAFYHKQQSNSDMVNNWGHLFEEKLSKHRHI